MKEALKMALEALEMFCEHGAILRPIETRDAIKAALEAKDEREVVANWIMDRGFATGHGDSIVDLLDHLEWQIAEREREACAKVCEEFNFGQAPMMIQQAIRARGNT